MIARWRRWRAEREYARVVRRTLRWSTATLALIASENPALARTTFEQARAVLRDPATGRVRLDPETLTRFVDVHAEAIRYEADRVTRTLG